MGRMTCISWDAVSWVAWHVAHHMTWHVTWHVSHQMTWQMTWHVSHQPLHAYHLCLIIHVSSYTSSMSHHTPMSRHTHVSSYAFSCFTPQLKHATHTNETCHTHEGAMAHTNESCHTCECCWAMMWQRAGFDKGALHKPYINGVLRQVSVNMCHSPMSYHTCHSSSVCQHVLRHMYDMTHVRSPMTHVIHVS